ncbi:histidine kinase [Methanocella sp. CWC-04]|uniref:histidine kinase n=1 Tax=Methanooceanicella nereidis TaxID=2052831 RepID=A0AAP2W6B5_9EURY|nr:HAMP domain-containing sensor histidine kinase [Methanocella sp. CWC-04]MCD1294104.1 histidine kinase [Methanocella sp. CWC-04]
MNDSARSYDELIIELNEIKRELSAFNIYKKSHKQLDKVSKKYEILCKHARDIILFIGRDGSILEANDAAIKAYGYKGPELLGMNIYDLRESSSSPLVEEQMEEADDRGILFETVHRRKDGTSFPVEVSSQGISFDGERVLFSIIRDITERKQAEKALKESEKNLATSQRIARLGSYEWDIKNNRIRWSEEIYNICRMDPENCKNGFESFYNIIHPDDREIVKKSVNDAIYSDRPFNIDFRIILPDGEERIIHGQGEVTYDDHGKAARMSGTLQDITERKRVEKELQEAKIQAELYVDLMGHDINNMNQIAMGYLELALDSIELDEDGRKLLLKPFEILKNSSKLIGNVRKAQRSKAGEFQNCPIDISAILSEIKEQYSNVPGRDVTISYSPVEGCLVMANELLFDVFSSLVGNAIKHSNGPLVINIELSKVTENCKDYCKVIVEDNGPGIPDSLKNKLFERLSLIKTRASGKGFGLCLTKMLVDDFNGTFRVEDRVPGDHTKGCRLVVLIPEA